MLFYKKTGTGSKTLISLHGYGLNNRSWSAFDSSLKDDFTIIHIDLPYHGESNPGCLSSCELLFEVKKILTYEKLSHEMYIMGFSLGANYALALSLEAPILVQRIVLLAPDGFQKFNYKKFLNRNLLGKVLRWSFIHFGALFKWALQLLKILRVYPKRTTDYFLESVSDIHKRELLMNRWKAVDTLDSNFRSNADRIPLEKISIIAGESDSIIKLKDLKRAQKIGIKLYVVNLGHNLMNKSISEDVRSALLLQNS